MSDFATLWTATHQALMSMGFCRKEHWSGLPSPPPGGLPDPEIKPVSLMSPALAIWFFTTRATWEAHVQISLLIYSLLTFAQLDHRESKGIPEKKKKKIYFCFLDYIKAFHHMDHTKLWKILKEMEYQTTLVVS